MNDPINSRLTRRQVLEAAGMTAAIAGAVGIGHLLVDETATTNNLADLPRDPISQEQANKIYADLYTHLTQEQETAKREHKKLVIVAGELTNNRNSLMIEHMVMDIARKLGIEDAAGQYDQSALQGRRQLMHETLKGRFDEIRRPGEDEETATLRYEIYPSRFSFATEAEHRTFSPSKAVEFYNQDYLVMESTMRDDIRWHAGDPKVGLRMSAKLPGGKIDPGPMREVETAMIHSVSRAANHHQNSAGAVAFFEDVHVPELVAELNSKQNLHAVGINCAAGVSLHSRDPWLQQREEALAGMYRPEGESIRQPTPQQALLMAKRAALQHRLDLGEISAEKAKKFNELLDDAEKGAGTTLVEKTRAPSLRAGLER